MPQRAVLQNKKRRRKMSQSTYEPEMTDSRVGVSELSSDTAPSLSITVNGIKFFFLFVNVKSFIFHVLEYLFRMQPKYFT